MSETAIVPLKAEVVTGSSYFVATNRAEMVKAQEGLATWVSAKLNSIKTEIAELSAGITIAKERKWASKSLISARNRALGRRTYYEKMLGALKAGYVLIPEFPISLFAIRTKREVPIKQEQISSSGWESQPTHPSGKLPLGEGEYKPAEIQRYFEKQKHKDTDGKGYERYHFYNHADFGDIAFPLAIAKPEIMSASGEAMALKIFDEIGVCPPNPTKKNDPLIIGRIVANKEGWKERRCSFLIAWHIDTKAL